MAVVWDQRNRNAGTYQSGSWAWPVGATQVVAQALMTAADRADDTLTLRTGAEATWDNGQTWLTLTGGYWVGGIDPRSGLPRDAPRFTWSGTVPPTHMRGVLDLPRRVDIGLDVTTT